MLRQPQRNTLLMLRALNSNQPASLLIRHAQLMPSAAGVVSFGGSRMFATKKDGEEQSLEENEEKPKRGRPKKVASTETDADLPKKTRKSRVTKA